MTPKVGQDSDKPLLSFGENNGFFITQRGDTPVAIKDESPSD